MHDTEYTQRVTEEMAQQIISDLEAAGFRLSKRRRFAWPKPTRSTARFIPTTN